MISFLFLKNGYKNNLKNKMNMETKIKNYTELTELHLFENRSGFSKIYKIENNKGLAIVKVEFHLSTGTFKVIVDKMGINSYPHIDYKNKMMLNIISTRLFHKLDKIRSVKCPKALKSFFIDLKKKELYLQLI